jgi:hypothetical protein
LNVAHCYTSNLTGRRRELSDTATSSHRVATPSCLVASPSRRFVSMDDPGAEPPSNRVAMSSCRVAGLPSCLSKRGRSQVHGGIRNECATCVAESMQNVRSGSLRRCM